jgi:hypothetical protein
MSPTHARASCSQQGSRRRQDRPNRPNRPSARWLYGCRDEDFDVLKRLALGLVGQSVIAGDGLDEALEHLCQLIGRRPRHCIQVLLGRGDE